MSTASSRLADIVRRKRGVMQMPEMDLTKPEMNPDLTEADINAVGEKPVVLPEMDLTAGAALDPSGQQSWPTNDPNADPDKVTPSEPVVTRGAVRTDEPSAVATQVTPLEPTINSVVPQQSRQAQLVAAIQRMGRVPVEDAPPEVADESKGQPFTVNGEVAKLATAAPMRAQAAKPAAAADPQVDEQALRDDLWNAQEADRKSRLTAGMELAGRQLVGGITRTEVGQGIGAAPSRVPLAEEQARERRKAVAAAIARKRQATMDASTLNLQASEADKNRRPPADKAAQPTSNRTEEDRLRAEKLQLERDKFNAKNKPKAGASSAPVVAGNYDSISDPGEKALVKAIVEDGAKPPDPGSKSGQHIAKLLAQVAPGFDWTRNEAYRHTRNSQATNPALTAIKTAYTHMNEALSTIDELGNSKSPEWNKIANWASTATGDPKTNRAKTALLAVGSEAAKAYEANDKEGRENVLRLTSVNDSPEQIRANLMELKKLLGGKEEVFSDTLNSLKPGANPSGTPDIPTSKTVGGVTYEKRSDGKWYPTGSK